MSSIKAWLSKPIEGAKVLCQACAHACRLGEGEYGECGVRMVEDGELQLLVYGRVAAANIDPVEKKPLYHFLPRTTTFSIGTVGCNFSCGFCQNHEISQYPRENNGEVVGRELPPEEVVRLALKNGCGSVSYTYNEPVIFFEYTYDCAKLAHEKGLKNIYVTSGYETRKAIDTIAPYLDAMNIDIKSFSEEFYENVCGAKLKPVLECVRYAYSKGIHIEITTLLILGQNDSDEEIREIARFIAGIDRSIPWHLSAFRPMYRMQDILGTPESTLIRAYMIAQEEGLEYVYIGNIGHEDYHSTYCPKCENRVIVRDGIMRDSTVNKLDEEGHCPYCGYTINGVWQ